MPFRFLFNSVSGYGHLHPLIPLARALKEVGHQVAFAAREFVRPRIASAGLEFFPVGSDRELDPEYQEFKRLRDTLPVNFAGELIIYNRLFIGIGARLMTPGLVDAARTWQPNVLIREGGEYASVIAAEHLGLPHATVAFTTALQGMSVFERGAAERLDPIRAAWGLAPDPELAALYRYLYLAYCPPSFGLHEVGSFGTIKPTPPTTHFIRPQFFDNTHNERLPAWIERLPAQPTVYLTLGTEVNNEPDLYPRVMQTIIMGLRDLPINLIVTLGRGKDPADFGTQPHNVHIEQYIPQTLLLPHCDLMVMHGGSNSLLEAIDLGLPLVLVPLIADQFFNAHIAQSIGLAQVIQLEHLTPETIQAAVVQVLATPSYRQTAARLQTEMRALPDQNRAIELLEQLAITRAPILQTP